MKLSFEKRKDMKTSAKAKGRERATMSEAESSDAPARRRTPRRDEPENHTRLMGGRKGHVAY